MEPKFVAGLLIYRVQKTPEFLLLNDTFSQKPHWSPPKGYVLPNEADLKAALRATSELTGLTKASLRIEPDFQRTITYLGSDSRPKQVVYFLAQISDHGRIIPPGEGIAHQWCNPTVAKEKVHYRNMQEIIAAAHELISRRLSQMRQQGAMNSFESHERTYQNSDFGEYPPGTAPTDRSRSSNVDWMNQKGSMPTTTEKRLGNTGYAQPLRGAGKADPAMAHADNPMYKTRLCERFEREGTCSYGNRCTYAHGIAELRQRPVTESTAVLNPAQTNPLYKTRLCERFMKDGFCQYGPKCTFAHGEEELRERTSPPTTPLMAATNGRQNAVPLYNARPVLQPSTVGNLSGGLPAAPAAYQAPKKGFEPLQPQEPLKQADRGHSAKDGGRRHPDDHDGRRRQNKRDDSISLKDLRQEGSDSRSWVKFIESPEMPAHTDIDHLNRKMEKLSTEETAAKELKEFFEVKHENMNDELRMINTKEIRHKLSQQQMLNAVVRALFDEKPNIDSAIKKRADLLKRVVSNIEDQVFLLNAFARLFQLSPEAHRHCLRAVRALYEYDLVEEEGFYAWERLYTDARMVQLLQPFFNWLRTADYE